MAIPRLDGEGRACGDAVSMGAARPVGRSVLAVSPVTLKRVGSQARLILGRAVVVTRLPLPVADAPTTYLRHANHSPVIASRLNLVCAAGHRHYAPLRELPEWIGHECMQGERTKEGLLAVRGRCRELLAPLTLPPGSWLQRSTSATTSAPKATPDETRAA